MRNISINAKMLVILGGFATFALGTAIYSNTNMRSIDARYTELLSHETAANVALAKANRALQLGRASIADIIMLSDPAAVERAENELKRSTGDFDRLMGDAKAALPDVVQLQEFATQGAALLKSTCARAVDMGRATKSAADVVAATNVFAAECQPGFPVLSDRIRVYANELLALSNSKSDGLTSDVHFITASTLFGMIGATLLVLIGAYFAVRTWLVRPINALRDTMAALATGDYSVDVRETDRRDEIGKMAATVEVFKRNGLEGIALQKQAEDMRGEAERKRIADQERTDREAQDLRVAAEALARSLQRLAAGDLTCRIETRFAEVYEGLRTNFNATVEQLSRTVGAVNAAVLSMEGGTREIAAGADDLSKRTEQQAASLEETAAAMEQITSNVTHSSKLTGEARTVAEQASGSATNSVRVVAEAESAMQRIEESSQQIANIIGVIDEIAFQTNLLALNAGVEAARAGDAGKGFAVVAQEVRELAQRSASAAKEIRGLIQTSTGEVDNGVKLVRDTGVALKHIVEHIAHINKHMQTIATSAQEQATGLSQVNVAVNQMDQATQQNAAMVEETTAAAASLASEAARLKELVSQFVLDGAANGSVSALRQVADAMAAPAAIRRPAPLTQPSRPSRAPARASVATATAADNDWQEF
ncbi:methyl-accepting chemotaxis protein [Rhizobium sp. RU20A]|uniref:methyl-accepting chemotaxis protein n=1 Tax=Rhizobium sp. RU20A TaxID=1907412 RepID=UPI000954B4E6|nr:methyl-accepting chemotaxis protein [Rhizobium sp. RU20A]SIR09583.1 methyl-accepting chemotaxis protein [Rhizobium sp. RU20A]